MVKGLKVITFYGVGRRVTVILFVLLNLYLLQACTSKEEAAEKFYNRGQAFYEKGELEKARIEFLNAIQRRPQYAQAYYALGLLAKDSNNVPLIFENMSIAMKLDDSNIEARIDVAQLLVYSQRFEEAIEITEEILVLDSNNIDGIRIKAAALIGQKSYQQAEALIDRVLKVNPQDDAVFALKAVIAKDQGKTTEALSYLNKALNIASSNTQYLLLRAGLNRELKDKPALEKDYRTLIQLSPEQAQYDYDLAQFLITQKRYDEAEEVLRELITRQPKNIEAKQRLVETIFLFDLVRGKGVLDNFIDQNPDATSLNFLKVQLFLKDKDFDKAFALLNTLSSEQYDVATSLKARALAAKVYLFKGEANKALEILNNNLAIDNQHEDSLLLMANYALNKQDFDTAVAHLSTLLRNNPTSEEGLVLLGHVYLQSGSNLLADDSFRQALDVNPGNMDAAMPVVRELIANQDLERSDKIITTTLSRNPDEVRLIALLAQIKLLKKEWSSVLLLADRLQNVATENIVNSKAYVHFLRGRVYQGQENFAPAITEFQQALALQPELTLALQGVAYSYIALDDEKSLIAYLEDFQNQHVDLVSAYLMAAQVLEKQGHLTKAEETITRALANKSDWIKGYPILVSYKKRLNKGQEIAGIYKKGIETNTNSIYLQVRLASHYESVGDYDLASEVFESILQDSPQNLLAINNYAALLLDKIATKESLQRALALSKIFKNSSQPLFIDTYGWALAKNGNFVEAEKYLRRASEQLNSVPDIYYHLGFTLKHLGRTQEARGIFKKALKYVGSRQDLEALIEREMIKQ